MRFHSQYLLIALLAAFFVACGGETTDTETVKKNLHDKKQELIALKTEITELEEKLIQMDSAYAQEKDKSILVALKSVKPKAFIHNIEVRGSVESQRNVMISAEAMGKITSIKVKEGQMVKSGQVLVELDADIIRKSIQELKTSLDLATTMYEKQKNLWEKNVGTEVQYLQAKNQKEGLERKLSTTYAQLENYIIRAPFSGQVNDLDVKNGEMMSPGMPICRVVSLEEMYISSDVSEKFIGKFNVGDSVTFRIPAMNLEAKSKITAVGKVINEQNRTFKIEIDLPRSLSSNARPNQVVVLTLTDYVSEKALTVPSRIVQKDSKGNYIYINGKSEAGSIASKRYISVGKSYKQTTEVLNGLEPNEMILVEGYRDVADGSLIKVNS